MKIYLCGPINGCGDNECNDWRSFVKERFPDQTIDPMRRDFRGSENKCVNEIVELDKKDVEDCDIVLANCPKPSVGTSMEIFYAHSLKKPVITIVPDVETASPWLKYHSMVMVDSLGSACLLIQGYIRRKHACLKTKKY